MNISVAGSAASKDASRFCIAARASAALLVALGCGTARASGPQFTFAGRIDQVTAALPPPWNGIRAGDSWEMTICLDPGVPDLCALPDRGCYPAGASVQLRIGGIEQSITGPASAQITIINAPLPRGDVMLIAFRLPGNAQCTLNLSDRTAGAFASTLLPECSAIASPALWTSTLLSFDVPGPGEAGGHLTHVICAPRLACGPCPDCSADYNQDGGIDGSDISTFFADWEAGLSCADVNHDGGIDNGDVSRFFRLWENGLCCLGSPDFNGDGRLTCGDLCDFYSDHRLGRGCADINADGAIDESDITQFIRDYIAGGGTGCAGSGDFNLDGLIDCADVCLFHQAFETASFAADVNCDGDVNIDDLLAFDRAYLLAGGTPCPRGGDFNLDGQVSCLDQCDFRRAFEAGTANADYTCDGQVDDADIAAFISAYSGAGGPACPGTGDFNLDGRVDCADQCTFSHAFAAGDSRADYTCDGVVDLDDALHFRAAYARDGGRPCPAGADFNLDGRVDCRDIGAFDSAVARASASADLNCDGQIDAADGRVFFTQLLDLNVDGLLNCADLCLQLERVSAGRPGADMNCDGSVDLEDATFYRSLFAAWYQGPACSACP